MRSRFDRQQIDPRLFRENTAVVLIKQRIHHAESGSAFQSDGNEIILSRLDLDPARRTEMHPSIAFTVQNIAFAALLLYQLRPEPFIAEPVGKTVCEITVADQILSRFAGRDLHTQIQRDHPITEQQGKRVHPFDRACGNSEPPAAVPVLRSPTFRKSGAFGSRRQKTFHHFSGAHPHHRRQFLTQSRIPFQSGKIAANQKHRIFSQFDAAGRHRKPVVHQIVDFRSGDPGGQFRSFVVPSHDHGNAIPLKEINFAGPFGKIRQKPDVIHPVRHRPVRGEHRLRSIKRIIKRPGPRRMTRTGEQERIGAYHAVYRLLHMLFDQGRCVFHGISAVPPGFLRVDQRNPRPVAR